MVLKSLKKDLQIHRYHKICMLAICEIKIQFTVNRKHQLYILLTTVKTNESDAYQNSLASQRKYTNNPPYPLTHILTSLLVYTII